MLPAVALFFLSPLVAEFLLGDFTLAARPALVLVAPLYGGGALLIREVARRAGRGWPAMAVPALAYGVLEQGLATQSLFNPDYAGEHLLTRGLIVTTVLFVAGLAATTATSFATGRFWASTPQLIAVVVIAAGLAVVAFRLPRRVSVPAGPASPWVLLVVTVLAGTLFMAGMRLLPTAGSVAAMLVAFAAETGALLRWGWTQAHILAAAAGGVLVYAGHSVVLRPLLGDGPVVTPVSKAVFGVAALVPLVFLARRLRRPAVSAGPAVSTPDHAR